MPLEVTELPHTEAKSHVTPLALQRLFYLQFHLLSDVLCKFCSWFSWTVVKSDVQGGFTLVAYVACDSC
jgi:hypothetical protein